MKSRLSWMAYWKPKQETDKLRSDGTPARRRKLNQVQACRLEMRGDGGSASVPHAREDEEPPDADRETDDEAERPAENDSSKPVLAVAIEEIHDEDGNDGGALLHESSTDPPLEDQRTSAEGHKRREQRLD